LDGVDPTSISLTHGRTGSKHVPISFAFQSSNTPFSYSVFISNDSSCLGGPDTVAWVPFASDMNEPVPAHTQYFYDYTLPIEASYTGLGGFSTNFCITTTGVVPSTAYAIPIDLLVSDDVVFQSDFE